MKDATSLIPQSATYHVVHETQYPYEYPVSLSQQMLHMAPRICAWQFCHEQSISIDPAPDWQREGFDAYGNPVTWMIFDTPHEYLHVRAEMDIEVIPHRPRIDLEDSLPWDELRDRLAYNGVPPLPEDLQASRYLFESDFVRIKNEFAAYSADCFPPGRPVLAATEALMQKIFREFKFDPQATTVATPVLEVLANKRGVCQDFAHLMLSCLRSLGIPCRYMSGYLLTHPPAGKPRLIGADASHAWLAVYCPGLDQGNDWVEFDPTNNIIPNTEHITLAWGRDFGDVSPMRGVILGGGGHEPEVAVTVMPKAEWLALQSAQA